MEDANSAAMPFYSAFFEIRQLQLVMGDIENFVNDNRHLKYHGYCKYHDTNILVVTIHKH